MKKVLDHVLSLNIEHHLDRLDYLILAACQPDKNAIEKGISQISSLVSSLKRKIELSKNTMHKSNELAAFLNYDLNCRLATERKTDNLAKIINEIIDNKINVASSLAMTLLHNVMAYRIGIGDFFGVFSDGDHFAPYFKQNNHGHSIFLYDCDNNGKPVQFHEPYNLHNLEAVSLLAKIMSKNRDLNADQKKYLANLSDKVMVVAGKLFKKKIHYKQLEYRIARRTLNYLQQQVADATGLDRRTYSDYERGIIKVSVRVDREIRYFLNLPIQFRNLGEEYRFYRLKSGLRQGEVGDRINKSQETISNYECNKTRPDAKTNAEIREVLGIQNSYYFS